MASFTGTLPHQVPTNSDLGELAYIDVEGLPYLPLAGGTMTGAITFAAGQVFLKWAIKTTTYTAVAGDALLANTTSGAFTITLPASPAANDYVAVADYKGTFATNNLTINSNGLNLMGSVQTLILNVNYRNVTLVYSGATQGWVIVL